MLTELLARALGQIRILLLLLLLYKGLRRRGGSRTEIEMKLKKDDTKSKKYKKTECWTGNRENSKIQKKKLKITFHLQCPAEAWNVERDGT